MDEAAPRFVRVVIEAEVEVLDLVQAEAFAFNSVSDGEGGVAMLPTPPALDLIQQVVGMVVGTALSGAGPRAGIRLLGSTAMVRRVDDNGDYPEFIIGAMPGRDEEGDYRPFPS